MTEWIHPSDQLLLRALDRELSASERVVVETHVAQCPECLGKLDRLADLSTSIARLIEATPAPAPRTSRDRLAQTLALETPVAQKRNFQTWAACGAIAACLVVALFAGLHRQAVFTSDPEPLPPSTKADALPVKKLLSPVPQKMIQQGKTSAPVQPLRVAAKDTKASGPSRASNSGGPFIALPYSNPALPLQGRQVVRVNLPVDALASAGIVSPLQTSATSMVQADLLLGVDGEPTGIRLVSSGFRN